MRITGIGARATPKHILDEMTKIGAYCKKKEFSLLSGHADGADLAFEIGAQEYCFAILPWRGFNSTVKPTGAVLVVPKFSSRSEEIAEAHHPAYDALKDSVKRLMQRNVFQVLGSDLDSPTDLVVCWTADGKASGGTGQALRIAKTYGVPIVNMHDQEWNTAEKVIEGWLADPEY